MPLKPPPVIAGLNLDHQVALNLVRTAVNTHWRHLGRVNPHLRQVGAQADPAERRWLLDVVNGKVAVTTEADLARLRGLLDRMMAAIGVRPSPG